MIYQIEGSDCHTFELERRTEKYRPCDVVAITGAGISVQSGLPTGTDLVMGVPLPEFFRSRVWIEQPSKAYEVYRKILEQWRRARPNQAHVALAHAGIRIITQNIDGLHSDSGSQDVIELHGNLRELLCRNCGTRLPSAYAAEPCESFPRCPTCTSMLLPGIVLEGEEVRHMARATEWVLRSQVTLIVGTELNMAPIRNVREAATKNAAQVIWISEDAESWVPQWISHCVKT